MMRIILIYSLVLLYSCSILSVFLTHTAHELHHLITHTMHLHHEHHEHHHKDAKSNQSLDHGHKHNDLIDTALQNINTDDIDSHAHTIVTISLFDHLTFISQDKNLFNPDNNFQYIQSNLSLSTQYTPAPPSPPPRYFNA